MYLTYLPTLSTYLTYLPTLPTYLPYLPTYLPTLPTYLTYLLNYLHIFTLGVSNRDNVPHLPTYLIYLPIYLPTYIYSLLVYRTERRMYPHLPTYIEQESNNKRWNKIMFDTRRSLLLSLARFNEISPLWYNLKDNRHFGGFM